MSEKHHRSISFHLAQEGNSPLRVSAEILKKMAAMREITGDDLLYNKSLGKWTKARHVKGLRTLFSQLEKTSSSQPLNTEERSKTQSTDSNIPKDNTKTLDKNSTDPSLTHAPVKKIITIPSQIPSVQSKGPTTKLIFQANLPPYVMILAFAIVTLLAIIGGIFWFRIANQETIITGIVSYNRMPIMDGEIVFDSNGIDSSEIKSEIINGSYHVTCKGRNASGAKIVRILGYRKPKTKQVAANQNKGKTSTDLVNYIAKEHNSLSATSVIIASGITNTFDFHLTGK
jgi:hypothetical protein